MKRTRSTSEDSLLGLTEPEDSPPPTLPLHRVRRVLPRSFSIDDFDELLHCDEPLIDPPSSVNRWATPPPSPLDVSQPPAPAPTTTSDGPASFRASGGRAFRNWFFTLNACASCSVFAIDPSTGQYALDDTGFDLFKARLTSTFRGWTMQLERGEQGRLHLQGVGHGAKKTTIGNIKTLLGQSTIHLEAVKDMDAATKYCSKDDTRYSLSTFFYFCK